MTEEKEQEEAGTLSEEMIKDFLNMREHLHLTQMQWAATEVIMNRMVMIDPLAEIRKNLSDAKVTTKQVKLTALRAAEDAGELAGPNAEARKLARDLVESTNPMILIALKTEHTLQAATEAADAVNSNLFHLYQVLLEAVKREAV